MSQGCPQGPQGVVFGGVIDLTLEANGVWSNNTKKTLKSLTFQPFSRETGLGPLNAAKLVTAALLLCYY